MTITFRYDSEMDIINFLDNLPSRQKFIKDAVINAVKKEIK